MGATHCINTKDEHWEEEYYGLTEGEGADMTLDTGGHIPAIKLAYDITRRQGRCVIASISRQDLPLNVLDLVLTGKEVIGTNAHTFHDEFPWAVQYIRDGRFDPTPIITDKIYIANGLEDGIVRTMNDRDQIKILVTPHRDWV